VLLRQVVHHRRRCVFLPPLDSVSLFDGRVIRDFTTRVRRGLGEPDGPQSEILVIDRASSNPYYASAATEVKTSGRERRSVSNMEEVARALAAVGECRQVDAALLSPREQVQAFTTARVLVGQHGAGLANMVWMAPGSTVVEILPPMGPKVLGLFRQLAAACGHRYACVRQPERHGPVAADEVVAAVVQAQHRPPEQQPVGVVASARRAASRVRLRVRRVAWVDAFAGHSTR
jgi:hypothetical protein